VQEKLENGQIKIRFIPSIEMTADILTKPLGANLHHKFTKMLGVQENKPESQSPSPRQQ
jgi:hypothetical protein